MAVSTTSENGGEAGRCSLCGRVVRLLVSRPPGDAPCPWCGTLLWFGARRERAVAGTARPGDSIVVTFGEFRGHSGRVVSSDDARGELHLELAVHGRTLSRWVRAWEVAPTGRTEASD